jgi:hypothetical protein
MSIGFGLRSVAVVAVAVADVVTKHTHTQSKKLTGHMFLQVSTTKGTGGDVIILEEAAYCDPGFFYETVAPLMLIGRTSLLAISTLTSEINFYSRLIKMKDSLTQVV